MIRLCSKLITIVIVAIFFYGCSTTGESPKDTAEVKNTGTAPLKVGITPDFPPIIFGQAQAFKGVEADLAKRLAEELGRPLEFVELPWAEQIPALLTDKTDIIMSGMSITKARDVRINLTEPYLKSGLLAAFRIKDRDQYNSIENILNSDSTIGVVKGTTGAVFAKKYFPNADRIIELSKSRDGGIELKRYVIDIFIHDAPSIIWLVSENEADLRGLWKLLNVEHLAWGVSGNDPDFETEVNNFLTKIKGDGTLDKILDQWLPYREMLKE